MKTDMKITLDSNPVDAPGCLKIVASDGRDMLVQTAWDLPGVASVFGWSIQSVQHEGEDHCEHDGTDGTVKCAKCGMPVSLFLQAARDWLDEHDGSEAEDPGYFS